MEIAPVEYARASDGTNVACASVGNGFPLLLAPGWVTHVEVQVQQIHALGIATNRRVILFDKRGTGLSDRHVPSVSLQAHVEDLQAVVDHFGLERFDLCGQSEGGPMAVRYAARNPSRVRRLILFGTFASGAYLPSARHDAMLRLVRAEWGLASEAYTNLFRPGCSAEEAAAAAAVQRRAADAEDAAQLWASLPDIDVTGDLVGIACPTMVIHVQGDRVVPFAAGRALAAGIPGSHLVSIPGDRHVLGPDEVPHFVEALTQFLDQPGEVHPMANASSAFRAILFTDVVASTPLLAQLKDAKMREVMRAHDEVLSKAVTGHGGA